MSEDKKAGDADVDVEDDELDDAEAADEAGDEAVDYVDLVRIHNVADSTEAQLVKSILESFRIPCHFEGESEEAVAALTGRFLNGVDVMVPDAYVDKAVLVLCERGIRCRIEEERLTAFTARFAAIESDAEARKSFALDLENEYSRDLRHGVLSALAARGAEGYRAAIELLKLSAHDEHDEVHVIFDLAFLVNKGVFGDSPDVKGGVVSELSRLSGSSSTERVRQRAAAALGRLKEASAGGVLVTLLADACEAVRDEAIESLYVLSGGQDFGFKADGTAAEREAAIKSWLIWHAQNPSL